MGLSGFYGWRATTQTGYYDFERTEMKYSAAIVIVVGRVQMPGRVCEQFKRAYVQIKTVPRDF